MISQRCYVCSTPLQATLSRLEGKRLAYDAERRRLSAAVAKASDAAAAGAAQSVSDEPSAAGSIAAAVEVAQLQEDAAAASRKFHLCNITASHVSLNSH